LVGLDIRSRTRAVASCTLFWLPDLAIRYVKLHFGLVHLLASKMINLGKNTFWKGAGSNF